MSSKLVAPSYFKQLQRSTDDAIALLGADFMHGELETFLSRSSSDLKLFFTLASMSRERFYFLRDINLGSFGNIFEAL